MFWPGMAGRQQSQTLVPPKEHVGKLVITQNLQLTKLEYNLTPSRHAVHGALIEVTKIFIGYISREGSDIRRVGGGAQDMSHMIKVQDLADDGQAIGCGVLAMHHVPKGPGTPTREKERSHHHPKTL